VTKAQRKRHIAEIKLILDKEIGVDRWDNYVINGYRFKLQKTSMRFERKSADRWLRIKSWYFKDLTIEKLKDVIEYTKQ